MPFLPPRRRSWRLMVAQAHGVSQLFYGVFGRVHARRDSVRLPILSIADRGGAHPAHDAVVLDDAHILGVEGHREEIRELETERGVVRDGLRDAPRSEERRVGKACRGSGAGMAG